MQDEYDEFLAEFRSNDDAVHHQFSTFESRQGTGSVPVAHANPEAAFDNKAEDERTEDGSGAASAGTASAGMSTSRFRAADKVVAGFIFVCAFLSGMFWPLPLITVVGVSAWVALLYICVCFDSDKLAEEFEAYRCSVERMCSRLLDLAKAHGIFWLFLKTSALVPIVVHLLGRLISAYHSLSSDEQVDAIAIFTGVPILVGLRFPMELHAMCSNSMCALATFYAQLTAVERLDPSDDNATAMN